MAQGVAAAAVVATPIIANAAVAYRLIEGRGVLSGHSAAALLDAECAPRRGAPAEVTLFGGNMRAHPGLVVRRDQLCDDEITHVREVACTTPLRTAFDLARSTDRDAAVVNRLANRHRFHPDRLLELYARYRGRRGVTRVPGVVALASPYAESPMETRLRLLIVGAGLPRPEVHIARHTRLVDLSWQVYRYTRREVYGDRARIVAELARARARCT